MGVRCEHLKGMFFVVLVSLIPLFLCLVLFILLFFSPTSACWFLVEARLDIVGCDHFERMDFDMLIHYPFLSLLYLFNLFILACNKCLEIGCRVVGGGMLGVFLGTMLYCSLFFPPPLSSLGVLFSIGLFLGRCW